MSEKNSADNVNVGKPKAGAYMWAALLSDSPTVPTDATTALSDKFHCLGCVSADGVSQSTDRSSTDVVDWHGDLVATADDTRTETSKFTLIECNQYALKQYYGEANVTVDSTSGAITSVKHNNSSNEEYCYVWETVMKDGTIRRSVVPKGKVADLDDVVYQRGEVVGYGMTIKQLPYDDAGDTAIDYYGKVTA